jgi:hypothetical protein
MKFIGIRSQSNHTCPLAKRLGPTLSPRQIHPGILGTSIERNALMDVLATVTSQINAAESALKIYRPASMDWNKRSVATSSVLVPWLIEVAPTLKSYVEDVLNAPALLRSMWTKIRAHLKLPKEQIEAFDRQLTLDDVLRESVTGEVVSNVVTKYLKEHHPTKALESNGRSDYPDIYLSNLDYSALPQFARKKRVTEDDEYGAAVKGKQKRPVRVPDGLEIKTCRERIAVDCHHPHAGLHLVLVFSETARIFTVNDLRVAFLSPKDYRESERNITATTVKYSFNGNRFVSILGAD